VVLFDNSNLTSVRPIVGKMSAGGRDSSVPVPKCPSGHFGTSLMVPKCLGPPHGLMFPH